VNRVAPFKIVARVDNSVLRLIECFHSVEGRSWYRPSMMPMLAKAATARSIPTYSRVQLSVINHVQSLRSRRNFRLGGPLPAE